MQISAKFVLKDFSCSLAVVNEFQVKLSR